MKSYNVPPTIPKTEKDTRDMIMENLKRDAEVQPDVVESQDQPPFYMTAFIFVRNLAENLKFWK